MDDIKQPPGKQIAETMKRIWKSGMTTATGGNISLKDTDGNIWTTPRGIDKGTLNPQDIVCVRPNDKTENEFGYLPTSEISFHKAIYRKRKDLNAIIHAHSSALVSFSFVRSVPDTNIYPHVRMLCGVAGFAPYKISGSIELAESISDQFSKGHNCIIMENHAAVVGGRSILEAYQRFEAFEFCARTIINANRLMNYNTISERQIDEIKALTSDLPFNDEVQSESHDAKIREKICSFAKRACEQQLMISSFGSISIRLGLNSFLITPEGKDRFYLNPDDIVQIQNGNRLSDKNPDSSVFMHLSIYQNHPEINSVVTSAAPGCMAYGISGVPMDIRTSPEGYVFLRDFTTVPFGIIQKNPDLLGESISAEKPGLMSENELFLVTGNSILQAFERLEVAEYTARSLIDAMAIGKAKPISEFNLKKLREKFLD